MSVILPVSVNAATWYMPWTWFETTQSTSTVDMEVVATSTNEIGEEVQATTTERVVIKTVTETKTVVVDNPALVAEIAVLKAQLAGYSCKPNETLVIEPVATGGVNIPENVVSLPNMPTLNFTGSMVGNDYVIPLSVTGEGWTKVYYSFVQRYEDGQVKASTKGFFYPNTEAEYKTLVFTPEKFGTNEYEYEIYTGSSYDSTRGTGKIVNSASGTVTIGE